MRNRNNFYFDLYCLSQYYLMLTLIYEARPCAHVFEKSSRRQGMCKCHTIPKCAIVADTFLNAQWKQFLLRFVLPEPIFFNVNINIRGTIGRASCREEC